MEQKKVISVDLDNTLIQTSYDYTRAYDMLIDYLQELGVEATREQISEDIDTVDYEMLNEWGLPMERFPNAFVRVAESHLDMTEEQRERVEHFGYSAYRNQGEYAIRGFMDGADQMLRRLNGVSDKLVITTVGDPRVQNPKIRALDLESRVDDVFVVPYNTSSSKKSKEFAFDKIRESVGTGSVLWHVGDSESSDIEAAVNSGFNAVRVGEQDDWLTKNGDTADEYAREVLRYNSASEFVRNFEEFVPRLY